MNLAERAAVAAAANSAARDARDSGGAPHLTDASDRAAIIAWLSWNDRNGSFADPTIWHEPVEGMLDPGWWVSTEHDGRRCFGHDEAAARAWAVEMQTTIEDLWSLLAEVLEDG